MKILNISEANIIEEAIETLKSGGLIIYPTETAYGVGVDATNHFAVSKLLEYKKRPEGKAISIAVDSEKMAADYVEINETAENFYQNFLPGPVTVISKSKEIVDSRLESEFRTLGIRMPNYKLILDLIEKFGKPITATSANSSGKKTPYSVQDVLDTLSEKQKSLIDLVIDGGELPHNPPSTVIDTTKDELTVYRQGRINPLEISKSEILFSKSVEQTFDIGNDLIVKNLKQLESAPLVILLNGELGAGKTHLTKGIAKALGIEQIIKSPTYSYVNEYKLQSLGKLYHFDAWRIQSLVDLEALQFNEWFKLGNVIVIEWPSVVMNLDETFFEKINYIYVDFVVKGEDLRELKIYHIDKALY